MKIKPNFVLSSIIMTLMKRLPHYLLLIIILSAAVLTRINSFWLAHDSNDEVINLALALKMETNGLSDMTLKQVNRDMFSLDGETSLVELMLLPGDHKGNILRLFEAHGTSGNDSSLFKHPPAFPFLLMLSQKSIGSGNGYFYSNTPYSKQLLKKKPSAIFFGQLYATIIPFIFGILLVFLVYLAGRVFFDAATGLIAAALIALNPVSLLISFRLWGDVVSICFLLIALLLVHPGFKNRSWFIGLLAGLSTGLGFLFQYAAILFILAVGFYHLWINRRNMISIAGLRSLLLNPFIIMLHAGFLIACTWWLFGMYQNTGTLAPVLDIHSTLNSSLLNLRGGRPHSLFLYTFGFLYLTPMAVFSFGLLFKVVRRKIQDTMPETPPLFIFIIITFLLLLTFVFESKEHRHALLAYVSAVIIAAWVINLIRKWALPLTVNWKWLNANELLVVMLIIAARWSVILALEAIERGAILITIPF